MKLKYYTADVFCEEPLSGNQLGVVILDRVIDDELMVNIARELNYSETTFVLKPHPKSGSFDVRIFTPAGEVPFAGHPTLGTAFIIANEIIKRHTERLFLKMSVGFVQVDIEKKILWLTPSMPEYGKEHYDIKKISEFIGLEERDIDRAYPIIDMSIGIPFIFIPLVGLDALKRAEVREREYRSYFNNKDIELIFIFTKETYNEANDISCRMFAPTYGVKEDPATGSANSCLVRYILDYNYLKKSEINAKIEQGYEIGRKSLLHLKGAKTEKGMNIKVGGKVVKVCEGVINI